MKNSLKEMCKPDEVFFVVSERVRLNLRGGGGRDGDTFKTPFLRATWRQTVSHVKVGLLFHCKEVRTQAEEPNACNCRNKASNHFLVWLIKIILGSLSLASLYKQ